MSRLIDCPECSSKIKREDGAVCPDCGFRITDLNKPAVFAKTRTQKEWFWAILLINVIIFALLTFCMGISGAKGIHVTIISILFFTPVIGIEITHKYMSFKNKLWAIIPQAIFILLLHIA